MNGIPASSQSSTSSGGSVKLDMRLYAEQGDFIILGGYPSDGKTALALSFAWHQSQTMKVGIFQSGNQQG